MRLGLWVVFLCLLGTVFNAALIRSIWPAAATADFSLILSVAIALYFYNPLGVVAAFLLGLLGDFSSAQFLGPNAAGCVLAFITVGLIANRMYAENFIAVMIITFACSLVKAGIYLGFLALYFQTRSSEDLSRMIVLEAILSALLAPLVIGIVRRKAMASAFGKSAKYGNSTSSSLGSNGSASGRWAPNSRLHWT